MPPPDEVIIRLEPRRGPGPGIVTPQDFTQIRALALKEVQGLAAALGFELRRSVAFAPSPRFPRGLHLFRLKLPPGMSLPQAISLLLARPGVVLVEPNYRVFPEPSLGPIVVDDAAGQAALAAAEADGRVPNDPLFVRQYALHNTGQALPNPSGPGTVTGKQDADIDAPEAWGVEVGDGQVVVAVIDTGIQPDHPDLAANMWRNPGEIPDNGVDDDGNGYVDDVHGWDFFHGDATVYDPEDREFHGTHVAGIIGAVANNGRGMAGVAWKVRIMALKFIGPDGGLISDAIEALAYAAAARERYRLRMLTNNSWGGAGYSEALKLAIEASDMLFVAAAGNDGANNDTSPHYPSSYDSPNILAVAATDWDDRLAGFSNYGARTVHLAAPGDMIVSAYPTDDPGGLGCRGDDCYAYASGTSMAAPHVAGVAALVMSRFPADDWPEVKLRILGGVDVLRELEGRVVTAGRLNAWKTLGTGPPSVSLSVSNAYAPPGTEVTFEARVAGSGGQLVDGYWDFGDGSPIVHGLVATHTYDRIGGFRAVFHATGADGQEATAEAWVAAARPGTVILVDGSPGSEALERALAAAGIEYARVGSVSHLPSSMTSPVMWRVGSEQENRLGWREQSWLRDYLSGGGRLLLFGEGVLREATLGQDGPTSGFAREVLHVEAVQHDVGATRLEGVAGDPISDGVRTTLDPPDAGADRLAPDRWSRGILVGDGSGFVALRHASGVQRLVVAAFRLESLPPGPVDDPASAPGLLRRIHAFLTEPPALAQALESALPIMAAPNPASREVTFYHDALSAPGASGGQVRVYNVAGRLVRTLSLNPGGRTVWDLTDDFGRPLASGLYLWLAFYPDGRPALQRPERLVIQR